jgi:hypothetical protein
VFQGAGGGRRWPFIARRLMISSRLRPWRGGCGLGGVDDTRDAGVCMRTAPSSATSWIVTSHWGHLCDVGMVPRQQGAMATPGSRADRTADGSGRMPDAAARSLRVKRVPGRIQAVSFLHDVGGRAFGHPVAPVFRMRLHSCDAGRRVEPLWSLGTPPNVHMCRCDAGDQCGGALLGSKATACAG